MDLEPQNTEMAISAHVQKLGTLAAQLGYEGSLALGSLEDEVRFYQQRTIESCIEIGKRLLLIKEQTPHGEFNKRIEMLNFTPRMAQKFMSAVLKFSKTNSNSLLQKAGNQTKLLELVMLDDDEIELLDQGGSIGDVNLDTIETLSVRELKAALREAKTTIESQVEDLKTKDLVIQKKDQKANELDEKLTKLNSPVEIAKREESEADQIEQKALEMMQKATLTFLDAASRFNTDMQTALDSCQSVYITEQYEANIRMTYQSIATRCNESGLPIDFEQMVIPDWLVEAIQEDSIQTAESGSEA